MGQTWTDNCFQSDHQGQTDLQDMEYNFACLKSMFEGAGQPSNPVPGMPWFDSTNKLPKVRNYANSAWLGIMAADASQKIWVYRNAAPDGWLIDATVTDCVIALKGGGATNPYNVSGGQTAGTWQQPGHVLTQAELPSGDTSSAQHIHQLKSLCGTGGEEGSHVAAYMEFGASGGYNIPEWITSDPSYYSTSTGDHAHELGGSDTAHDHGSLYRPAAAVGTLQYMNI